MAEFFDGREESAAADRFARPHKFVAFFVGADTEDGERTALWHRMTSERTRPSQEGQQWAARQVRIILRSAERDTRIEGMDRRAGPKPLRCARRLPHARSAGPCRVASLFARARRETAQRPGRCAGLPLCRCPARYRGEDGRLPPL